MSALDIRTSAAGEEVATSTRSNFVALFALAAIGLQSAFSIFILMAAPDLVRSPVIWVLWAFVVVVAVATILVSGRLASEPASG